MDIHIQHTPKDGDFFLMKLRIPQARIALATEGIKDLMMDYSLQWSKPTKRGLSVTYPANDIYYKYLNELIPALLNIERGGDTLE